MSNERISSSVNLWSKNYKFVIYAALIVVLALFPVFISSPFIIHICILTLVYIIATTSLRLVMTSGQFPLAHAAFMGIGAYSSAMISKYWGWSPWLTIPVGALLAMGLGIFIGFPFSKLRTFYYAMVSVFFGAGIVQVIVAFGKYTGGSGGLAGIPTLFGATSKIPYFYFFLALTVISVIIMYRLEFSRFGLNLKAIDQSYLVAGSIGINEARSRVVVLGIGCFFAGLTGAAYAAYNMGISPTNIDMTATLWLVMYVVVGGVNNFAGPIIGTVFLFMVPQFYRGLKEYTPFLTAGLLFIVIFLIPKGIVSLPKLIWLKFKERKTKREISQ
jgi:branched-chain amino acid transport system permease protein